MPRSHRLLGYVSQPDQDAGEKDHDDIESNQDVRKPLGRSPEPPRRLYDRKLIEGLGGAKQFVIGHRLKLRQFLVRHRGEIIYVDEWILRHQMILSNNRHGHIAAQTIQPMDATLARVVRSSIQPLKL